MTTALYRRYRPESFQDVIGQEHVTEPLMTALRKNRVNHAYLFSGPRGCGKTTSARILARCLNCAEGPTATPCGHCDSCRDLARDGAGSLDVIEMDAASHGGVDHARDLRERATFAPVRDRFKIFIIDEAHMVTREGFNALLKIVEEPPEHVMFIFATTEPSKVLTTIRSRTHHYPFRLVPPEPLMHYLEALCEQEQVATEPGVLSLVVRAGGGSVRDSLSVLDQLMAGADERGLTYDLAVALLGYTHAALLDDVVDAFAAGDAPTVFGAVDRVVQTGQDPRRFVEDLLERFRDLVVVNAVPESAANILHGTPSDQINRLHNQATQLGAAELSRAADIINTALNEMTGATSPQLHLELLCARILLPSADHTTRGITARVDRLERRLSIPRGAGIRQGAHETEHPAPPAPVDAAPATSPAPPADPEPTAPAVAPATSAGPAASTPDTREPTDPQDGAEEPEGTSHPAAAQPVPESERPAGSDHPPADGRTEQGEPRPATGHGGTAGAAEPQTAPSTRPDSHAPRTHSAEEPRSGQGRASAGPSAASDPEPAPEAAGEQGGNIDLLRASWTEIVSSLAEIRRVAWTVTMRGTPVAFHDQTLRIAFEAEGDLLNFPRFENDVRAAIHSVLGIDCRVEAVRPGDGHGGADGGTGRGGGPQPDPPSGPRAGPSHGNHPQQDGPDPGPRQPGPGAGEPPEYFREQEGFGAHRHRNGAPAPSEQSSPEHSGDERPRSETAQQNPEHAGRDRSGNTQQRAERPQPSQEQESRESRPEPSPDEPVTSWSVARIPGGAPSPEPTAESPRDAPAHTTPEPPGQERPANREEPEDTGDLGRQSHPSTPPRPEPTAAPPHRSQEHNGTDLAVESGSEYWTPDDAPPPPEDEPPADLYDPPAPRHETPPRSGAPDTAAQNTNQQGRPSFRERHAAEIAAARRHPAVSAADGTPGPSEDEDFTPSADDESIEDSSLYGRAAIERMLGGLLIDERPHHANQS